MWATQPGYPSCKHHASADDDRQLKAAGVGELIRLSVGLGRRDIVTI